MSFSRVLVVIAMLVALIGQALAYSSMSCDMTHMTKFDASTSETSMSHEAMDHLTMSHKAMDHANMDHMADKVMNMEDCCDVNCTCPANACSSIFVLESQDASLEAVSSSESLTQLTLAQPVSSISSLYRPPIFA